MPEKYIQNTSTDREKDIKTNYIDLACSLLGGKVLSCSDEFFAEAENLIKREKPVRDPSRFTDRGAWYDGWETRRHNHSYDWVIIKLAFAGTIDAFDIDTSYFNGNHPPAANVEGCHSPDKDPVPGDDTFWVEILPRVDLGPSASHYFKAQTPNSRQCYTHVRLNIYPDGGVARFRVYGNVRPIWPRDKRATIDLAFIGNGGQVVACSDQHFGAKDNILLPGRGKDMSGGWETKRSRVPGHCDWIIVRLGAPGHLKDAEIDTAYFKGNFPESVMLDGCFSDLEIPDDTTEWENILPRSKLGPDKQHYFRLKETRWQFSHVRMTMYPDGGIKRLRLFGQLALTNNGETNGHSVDSHNTSSSYAIDAAPLTNDQFAAYGQVIEAFAESNLNSPFAMSITHGIRVTPANQGTARKYNHIAKAANFRQSAITQDGKLISKAEQNICLYHCQPTTEFPFKLKLLERHLYSSQAFIPLDGSSEGYLVIVCLNGQDDKPDLSTLRAFVGSSKQGINYFPGVWHHPMIALKQVTDFVCLVHESGVTEEDCEEIAIDDNITIKLPGPIDYNN
ncbi:10792_t:CDS:2 [Paraglomus brasilianum]|uniref:allantoicase n=1 Tax=Paraglomus brasilianum TaxID=144538 RepID=A0A9N9A6D3_9GLOM|nr:10792_t:CDS:2 [Paraglomus brasilianum]